MIAEPTAPKAFLAARNDGLGERLKAMLNALVLSEVFDLPFRFQWRLNATLRNQNHAIESRLLTFGTAFQEACHVQKISPGEYDILTPHVYKTRDDLLAQMDASRLGLLVNQEDLNRLVDLTDLGDLTPYYRRAFERIEFSPALEAVMNQARNVPLPDHAVAIHLRAGDIIYGDFRTNSAVSHKALCYPVVKHIITTLKAAGKYPLIFGQDMDTCRLLAKKYDLKLACDFINADGSNRLHDAMAEIILMSRCDEIYAGVSGFSKLASMIGGKDLLTPLSSVDDAQLIDIIANDSDIDDPGSGLSDLQRAFSFYTMAFIGIGTADRNTMIAAVDKALSYDRVNAFYSLLKARLQTTNHDPDAAEVTLKDAIRIAARQDGDFQQTLLAIVLRRAHANKREVLKMNIRGYLNILPKNVTPDRPYTAAMAALAALAAGHPDVARDCAAQIRLRRDTVLKKFLQKLDLLPAKTA